MYSVCTKPALKWSLRQRAIQIVDYQKGVESLYEGEQGMSARVLSAS